MLSTEVTPWQVRASHTRSVSQSEIYLCLIFDKISGFYQSLVPASRLRRLYSQQPAGCNAQSTPPCDASRVFHCRLLRSQEKTTVKWHSRTLPITALSPTRRCVNTHVGETDPEDERERARERERDTWLILALLLTCNSQQRLCHSLIYDICCHSKRLFSSRHVPKSNLRGCSDTTAASPPSQCGPCEKTPSSWPPDQKCDNFRLQSLTWSGEKTAFWNKLGI